MRSRGYWMFSEPQICPSRSKHNQDVWACLSCYGNISFLATATVRIPQSGALTNWRMPSSFSKDRHLCWSSEGWMHCSEVSHRSTWLLTNSDKVKPRYNRGWRLLENPSDVHWPNRRGGGPTCSIGASMLSGWRFRTPPKCIYDIKSPFSPTAKP